MNSSSDIQHMIDFIRRNHNVLNPTIQEAINTLTTNNPNDTIARNTIQVAYTSLQNNIQRTLAINVSEAIQDEISQLSFRSSHSSHSSRSSQHSSRSSHSSRLSQQSSRSSQQSSRSSQQSFRSSQHSSHSSQLSSHSSQSRTSQQRRQDELFRHNNPPPETRIQFINTRNILESNISLLYNINNDILQYLDVSQLLYFTRTSLQDNYYYRKLELSYGEPVINKFNQICQDTLAATSVQEHINNLFYLQDFLANITSEFDMIQNTNLLRNRIITDIMSSIANEKTIISDLIDKLNLRISIAGVSELIESLNARFNQLNSITRETLNVYYSQPEFNVVIIHLETLIVSIILLTKIIYILLCLLIISPTNAVINIFQQPNTSIQNAIINHMYIAITTFTFIVNNNDIYATIYANRMERLKLLQVNSYIELLVHLTDELRANIQVQIEPVIFLEDIANDYNSYRHMRETRTITINEDDDEREEIIEIAVSEADIARSEPSDVSEQTIHRSSNDIQTIMNEDDIIFDRQLNYDEIADIYKIPNSILPTLRTKYREYSKDFKTQNDRNKMGKIIQKKYKLYFNKNNQVFIQSITHFIGHSIASLFGRYLLFGEDIKFNNTDKYYVANYILIKNDDQSFTVDRQPGIDIGGLRRDFITSLINELYEKKIFITRDGTQKYFLNPDFKMDDEFKFVVNTINSSYTFTNNVFMQFYNFIGVLLTFLLVNDCGITNNISSYLIANFYTPEKTTFSNADYVYFMLDDFPEFATSIINLMKKPETIVDAYIDFNSYYKLSVDADEEVTKDNIEAYLIQSSKFMMTTTILRKNIEITLSDSEYERYIQYAYNIHNWVIEGIPRNIKTKFLETSLTLKQLTSYLVAPTMSHEIANKIKDNFTRTMKTAIQTIPRSNKGNYKKFTKIFIDYVLTKKTTEDEQEYFKFMTDLLKFWSGSLFFKNSQKYRIKINLNLSDIHLPQSHTCFFTIDIPNYTGITTQEIGNRLYEKIKMAVSNTEQGIGIAGGCRKGHYRRLK